MFRGGQALLTLSTAKQCSVSVPGSLWYLIQPYFPNTQTIPLTPDKFMSLLILRGEVLDSYLVSDGFNRKLYKWSIKGNFLTTFRLFLLFIESTGLQDL